MRIRPSAPYNKIVFDSGGQKITYFNAKERWDDLPWPARGALFHFYFPKGGEGELGYTDGEWALFHLLEDGKLTAVVRGRGVPGRHLDAAAGRRRHPAPTSSRPALLRAFRGMEMPRRIVNGAAGCGRLRRGHGMSDDGDRTAIGVYGKVRTQPDFLRANAGEFSARPASTAGSRTRWRPSAPSRRRCRRGPTAFLLAPAESRVAFVGAFAPSTDAAGRVCSRCRSSPTSPAAGLFGDAALGDAGRYAAFVQAPPARWRWRAAPVPGPELVAHAQAPGAGLRRRTATVMGGARIGSRGAGPRGAHARWSRRWAARRRGWGTRCARSARPATRRPRPGPAGRAASSPSTRPRPTPPRARCGSSWRGAG